jgi:hypothetical protein
LRRPVPAPEAIIREKRCCAHHDGDRGNGDVTLIMMVIREKGRCVRHDCDRAKGTLR